MTEVASLGFAINTAPVKAADDDLGKLAVTGAKAEKSVESLEDAAKRLGVTTEELRKRIQAAGEAAVLGSRSSDRMSESMDDVYDSTKMANDQLMRAVQINREVATSVDAANDNVEKASGGLRDFAAETTTLISHLKMVALAAYALVPALRPIFHSAILAGLQATRGAIAAVGAASTAAGMGLARASFEAQLAGTQMARFAPVTTMVANGLMSTGTALSSATGAAGGMLRVATSLMSVLSRITLPITILVTLWQTFNALVDQGAALLEKYGNQSRVLDDPGMAANLQKLTALQQGDKNVTASQAKTAAELNARLEEARFKLQQILETQINLNGVALFFQRVWVNIVEVTAQAASNFFKILETMVKIAAVPIRLGAGVVSGLTASGVDEDPSVAARRDQMRREAAAAELNLARQRALDLVRTAIATGQGTKAGDPEAALEKFAATLSARWNMIVKDLVTGGEKAAEKTKELTDAFDAAHTAANRAAVGIEADAKAVGMSVGEHAKLRVQMRLQEVAQDQVWKSGKGKVEDYDEAINKVAERTGRAVQKLAELRLASDIKFRGDTTFFSDTEKQIASILKQIYGDKWRDMMKSPIADTMRWNDMLLEVNDTLRTLGSDLGKAILSGQNLFDALISSVDKLAQKLLDKAFQDALMAIVTMDPMMAAKAGVEAAAAIGLSLFSQNSKQQKAIEEAQATFAAMTNEVDNFIAAASGFDLSPFVQAIQQIEDTTLDLVKAAVAAGNTAKAVQIIMSAVQQVNNQVDRFIKPTGEGAAAQIAQIQDEAQQIVNELNSLNAQYNVGFNRTAEIVAAAAEKVKKVQAEVKKTLESEINDASGKGFLNDIQTLVDRMKEFRQSQSATGVDTSLIDRWFEVNAQKIVDGAELTGDAFNELVVMFPELTGKVREYTDAVEDNSRAIQQASDEAARNIVDFLNELQSGTTSTFSPAQVLANARAAFDANLPLAQAGNIDAQNKFVELANNLLSASRAVNASSTAFQDDLNMIISTGLGLPAVTGSSDPLIQALADNVAATQANTNATGTNTGATNTLSGTTGSTSDSFAALLVKLTDFANQVIATTTNITNLANQIVTSANNIQTMSGNIVTLSNNVVTSAGEISALANQLGGPGGTSQKLLDLANTIGNGGDQQLRAKMIALATEVSTGAANITTMANNVSTSASNISTLGTNIGTASANVAGMATNIGNASSGLGTVAGNTLAAIEPLTTIRNTGYGGPTAVNWSTKDSLIALVGIEEASRGQLNLLRESLVAGPVGINAAGGLQGSVTSQDQAIVALRKIVFNTAVIAANTYTISNGNQGSIRGLGTFAAGGIANPGMPFIYGEHHPRGPFFDIAGPRGVAISTALPPDSGERERGLNALILRRLDQLETVLSSAVLHSGREVAMAVREKGDEGVEATDELGLRLEFALNKTKDMEAA